jgi:hypothetical protein
MNGRFVTLLAAVAFGATTMFGTTVSVSLGNNPFPNGNTSPFLATVGGVSELIYCDDDLHTVYANESWTATETSFNSVVSNISSTVVEFRGLPNATTLYEEAAWLVFQFASHPLADATGIQTAIWDLMTSVNPGSSSNQTTAGYWYGQASSNYTSLTTAQKAELIILTPVAGSQIPSTHGAPQEFFAVAPEPGTYALFGSGLILLSLGTFRRRGKKVN